MSASVIRYLPCSICDACRSQRRYPNMPGIQRTCEIQYLQWLQCSMVSTNSIGFPWFLCKLLGVQVKRIGFIKFTNFTKAQPKLTQDLWVQYHLHSENTVEVGKQLPNQALRVVWEWSYQFRPYAALAWNTFLRISCMPTSICKMILPKASDHDVCPSFSGFLHEPSTNHRSPSWTHLHPTYDVYVYRYTICSYNHTIIIIIIHTYIHTYIHRLYLRMWNITISYTCTHRYTMMYVYLHPKYKYIYDISKIIRSMVFPWFSHLFHPFPAQPMIIFTQCSVSTAASSSSWERTDKRVVLEEALGLAQSDININIIYIYIKRERDKLIFIYILDIYIYIYIHWKYIYMYLYGHPRTRTYL